MLKLSKKADYALVALSHLQQKQGAASTKEIAEAYKLSNPMLANVMKSLAGAGFLSSTRGSQGGYSLEKRPTQIILGEVIALFDGPSAFSDCSDGDKDCISAAKCPTRRPMLLINKKIKDFMNGISLADLAAGNEAIRTNSVFSIGMYHE